MLRNEIEKSDLLFVYPVRNNVPLEFLGGLLFLASILTYIGKYTRVFSEMDEKSGKTYHPVH